MRVITNSPEETIGLGKQLGRHLKAGDVLGLIGELGSGKTTLIKGIASGLGVRQDIVASPSFVLIKEYPGRKLSLYHFDLYRLNHLRDIEHLGVEEYLFNDGVCVIEWAEKLKMLLPDYLQINLAIKAARKREIKFSSRSKEYESFLKRFGRGVASF